MEKQDQVKNHIKQSRITNPSYQRKYMILSESGHNLFLQFSSSEAGGRSILNAKRRVPTAHHRSNSVAPYTSDDSDSCTRLVKNLMAEMEARMEGRAWPAWTLSSYVPEAGLGFLPGFENDVPLPIFNHRVEQNNGTIPEDLRQMLDRSTRLIQNLAKDKNLATLVIDNYLRDSSGIGKDVDHVNVKARESHFPGSSAMIRKRALGESNYNVVSVKTAKQRLVVDETGNVPERSISTTNKDEVAAVVASIKSLNFQDTQDEIMFDHQLFAQLNLNENSVLPVGQQREEPIQNVFTLGFRRNIGINPSIELSRIGDVPMVNDSSVIENLD